MKMNMNEWLRNALSATPKLPMPLLSFPAISLLNIKVSKLISDSDLQAEGMRLVAENTNSLASVSLMDLSVEAECFGSKIRVFDDEVPTVTGAIVSSEEEADALRVPSVGEGRTGLYINAIKKAVTLIKDRPVFAGIIGPYSLAGRLMDVSEAMVYCYEEPDMVHKVMEKTTAFLIEYAKAYREAGANGIVMAEPLTGLLSPKLAEEFSEPYVRQIIEAVQDENFAVIYHNCGNYTVQMIDSILRTGAFAFHFGNAVDMADIMANMPSDKVAMGNIDPAGQVRNGTPESIREHVLALRKKCGDMPNFILSTGCDVPPMSPWENINAFFKAAVE